MENTQQLLEKIRPPRVQITYDVQVGDAIVMKSLPFVGGILADLAGQSAAALPPLKDREFVDITGDNFDEVMAGIGPSLFFQVPNALSNDGSMMDVALSFNCLDDFGPVQVAQQTSLKGLYQARTYLSDLLARLQNGPLEEILQQILTNQDMQKTLAAQLKGAQGALSAPASASDPSPAADSKE